MGVTPITLVTWFHADEAERAGSYSQMRIPAASAAGYEVYLRCIDVCAASFQRWNPDGECIVVMNPGGDAAVGLPRRALWERMGVRIVVVPNTHRPDVDLFAAWQNQFFLFDVLRAAVDATEGDETPIAVIDSDVLVRGPLDGLARAIAAAGRVRMRIEYTEDELANGTSRRDLAAFVADRTGVRPPFVPEYQGGEFVAGTREALSRLVEACDEVYAWTLTRQVAGGAHPKEEAHMISVADPAPRAVTSGNAFIERIWTKPWNYRNVPANVDAIPLWHLPAEKRSGLDRLHPAVLARGSWFWRAPARVWRARTSAIVGVPDYTLSKALQDAWALRADILPALRARLRPFP